MLEKLSKRLVPYGRAHPRLKWPILGLLMLAWCLDGAWAFARAMGRELRKVGQEAAAHLRETGLTPQGIHDNAERLLDAGIRGAKKLPGLWNQGRQVILPLVYTKGRAVFHTARQWFLARISAVKVAAPVCYARVKTLAMRTLCGVAGFAHRTGDKLRADLPQYRRHAPQRAMAATLALVMCLGLLPVSAFAAETGCTHVHDASCYHRELTCGQDEAEAHAHEDACYTDQPICGVEESAGHSHTDGCNTETQTCTLAEHSHGDACYNEANELICGQEEHAHGPECSTRERTCGQDASEGHTHSDACYITDPVCGKAEAEGHTHTDDCDTETLDCQHVHDETCGGLPQEPEVPAVPECTCNAAPDAEGNTIHAEDCPLYTAPEQPSVLTEITSLEGAPEAVQTAMEGAWDVQSLPATLTGVYEGGTVEVPISWDGLPVRLAKGDYALTARLTPPEGYALAEGVNAPTVALTLTPDPEVETVRALMADLPAPEAIQTMSEEEREASGAYEKMEAAYNAYDALTEAQKALLPGAMDTFTALQEALGKPALMTGEVPLDEKVTWFTSGTTYTISDITQLNQLAALVKKGSASVNCTFVLTADIYARSQNWVPIGESGDVQDTVYPFEGIFDGGDHTIAVDVGRRSGYASVGLFSKTASTAVIKNLTVAGSRSGDSYTGGIVGMNRGLIQNCVSNITMGNTEIGSYFGGIAGVNEGGTIEHCVNNADLIVEGILVKVGGIAGDSYSTEAGSTGSIRNCRNNGKISAPSGSVGGIVGGLLLTAGRSLPIVQCYNAGAVSIVGWEPITSIAGGIVGAISQAQADASVLISDCYNTADITSLQYVGGIVGTLGKGTVKNCYSMGTVTLTVLADPPTKLGAGGIIGGISNGQATLDSCMMLGKEVTGAVANRAIGQIDASASSTGTAYVRPDLPVNYATKVSADASSVDGADIAMGTPCATVFAGWDTTIWDIPSGNLAVYEALPTLKSIPEAAPILPLALGYPSATPLNPFLGVGSEGNPYRLDEPQDLYNLAYLVNNKIDNYATSYYFLENNLVGGLALKYTWTPIGNHPDNPFNGTLIGTTNGAVRYQQTIEKAETATVSDGQYLGLFGVIGEDAVINDLKVIFSTTVAAGTEDAMKMVGSLAGWNKGHILNCSSTGLVYTTPNVYAGGLVGYHSGGIIENSYSDTEVNGRNVTRGTTGGVVGAVVGASTILRNCYSYTGRYVDNDGNGLPGFGGVAGSVAAEAQVSHVYGREEFPLFDMGGENVTISGSITYWGYVRTTGMELAKVLLAWVEEQNSSKYRGWSSFSAGVHGTNPPFGAFYSPQPAVSFYALPTDTVAFATVVVGADDKVSPPTNDPTRLGYTFAGWYTSGGSDGTAFDFANTTVSDATRLYAHWNFSAKYDGWTYSGTYDGKSHNIGVIVPLVEGTTYTYQWSKDDKILEGATNSTYPVTNYTDSGYYLCTITATSADGTSTTKELNIPCNIRKASKDELLAQLTIVPYEGTYDGIAHPALAFVYAPDGSTVKYCSYSPKYDDDFKVTMPNYKNVSDARKVWVRVENPNYVTYTSEELMAQISPAVLTPAVDMSGYTNRVYDGKTTVTGGKITLLGAATVNGVTEKPIATAGTLTFDTADAGTNKTVSATGIALSNNTVNKNYTLNSVTSITSQVTDKAITPAPLTITAKPTTITYGDKPACNAVTYTGFVNSETEAVITGTLDCDSTYAQFGDVGSAYTITPKGLSASNYNITFAPGKLTVAQKTVGLSWTDPASLVYDDKIKRPTVTVTGTVNGDELTMGYTTFEGNGAFVGKCTWSTTSLMGEKKANYKLPAKLTHTFTITARPVTITAKAQTVSYGTEIALGVTQVEVAASTADTGLVEGHELNDIWLDQSTTDVTTSGTINPYGATIKPSRNLTLDRTANYAISYVTGSLTITAGAYPNPPGNPTASATFGDTLSEVSVTSVTGGKWGWKDGTTMPAVGTGQHPIFFTPTDTNYDPIELTATVNVNPKALTLPSFTATGRMFEPGDTTVEYTVGALSELVPDFETVVVDNSGVTASIPSADQGTHNVMLSGTLALSGEHAGNYTLTKPKNITVTITPRDYGNGEGFSAEPIPSQPYTGVGVEPGPKLSYKGVTLVRGTDYEQTLTYANNTNKGTDTASVTATLKGNYSGSVTVKFSIVDSPLPPEIGNDNVFTVTTDALGQWHNEDITLTTKTGWTVSTDATTWGSSVKLSTESTKVNEKIVPSSASLFVKNSAGNIYLTTVTYLLDKTMPLITVVGETEGEVVGSWGPSREITFTVTDSLSGIIYVSHCGNRIGNNEIIELELSPDGSYTFTALVSDSYTIGATDGAENYISHGFVTQQLDGVKPTATFGELTPNENGWFTSTVTVNVEIDDPESTPNDTTTPINESDKSGIKSWEYSLDGGTNWLTGSGSSFTIDASGDYTDKLKLRATDNAGNVSEIATTSVKLDKATPGAPTVEATVDVGAYDGNFTARTVDITATAAIETLTSGGVLQYKIGGGEWQVYTAPIAHSTNTPVEGVIYTFRTLSGAGTASVETSVTVKRQALEDSVLTDAQNKYADNDLTIGGEGVKDGWYTENVTVTVTPKPEITVSESEKYPADTYYKVDGGEKVKLESPWTIDITTDGTHALEIWTEDVGGNETTHLTVTIKVDQTTPTITDVMGNPTNWTKDDANITFTAADATSGVASVTVKDSKGDDYSVTENKSFVADKNETYTITVTDNAGKTTTETVVVDKIDKATLTEPTVTGYKSDTWVKEPITFVLATGDIVSSSTKFQVKAGDADWADITGSTCVISDNTDGVAYSFRTISGVGATSETVDFTVKLDKTTPVVSLTATADGAAYTGAATAHDVVITPRNTAANISGQTWFYQKAGDVDWTTLEGDALTVNFNCDTTFTFKAVSGAGVESATRSVTVQRSALTEGELAETAYGENDLAIDKSPDENGWYTEKPTITVSPKDTVGTGGLDATTYYELVKAPETSGTKTELTDPWTITPGSDGEWTLKIWTEDAAGNKTNAYETTVKVDTTDPTITDVAGNPTAWQNTDATITFTAADATSGVKSVVVTHADGQSVTYTNGSFTADRNGEYTITVTDEAGHPVTETVTVTHIEKTAPVISDVTLSGTEGANDWYTDDVTVTVTATDEGGSALAADAYSFDGGTNWQSGNSQTYNTNATHTVTVWVRDTAGNITKRDAVELKLDKETPTAPTVTATAGGEDYNSGTFTGKDVVFTLSGAPTTSGHAKYQVSTDAGATWQDVTGSTLTHSTNTTDAGVDYQFRTVNNAGSEGTASADITVKRRALVEDVLTNPDNVYQPEDLEVGQQPGVDPGQPGDPNFPYAPYWWPETPTITVPEIPYIKDPTGPVIPGTDPAVNGYATTTYYLLWREGVDEKPTKQPLTAPFAIKPSADGIWTLELWTEDRVGSETTHLVQKIQVDTTAPTVADVTGNAAAWQKTDVTLTVNGAADATSGLADLAYSFDGGATWQAENAKTFAANTIVTVWVRDKVGHSYQHAYIAVNRIDKTAPVVSWSADTLALNPDKWYGVGHAVTAVASDDSGETPTIVLKAGGKVYVNGGALNDSGVFSFTATATDAAGNMGKSEVYTVRIEPKIDEFVAKVAVLGESTAYGDLLKEKLWYDALGKTMQERLSKSDEAKAAYDRLLELLNAKADEAVSGLTDKIKDADTLDEIEQAKKDYDALPGEVKKDIPAEIVKELEKKTGDAAAAQKVLDQLANADRDKGTNGGKDPGGSVDEKEAAQDAYDKLTDDQKALVNKDFDAAQDKGNIDTDLGKINEVLDLLKDIKKPYTPTTKDQIKAAQDAYDALTQKQKDAFPKTDKAKLDTLEVMRQHAQNVEDKITALGENPSLVDLNAAKGAYNALTADERAMVDGTLKAELDKKYQDALDKMTADEKAAAEFAAKVEEVKNAPTVEKIEQLIKDHDALSDAAKDKLTEGTKDDYQKLVDDLNKAKPVIKDLDSIDVGKLTPQDMDKAKDVLDRYDDLTEDQKKLVDDVTKGKPGILDEAVKGVDDVTDKIESIPNHSGGSTNPGGGPNLGDCENSENENASGSGSGGHTYEEHRKAIEDAKIAYEKLTDAGRKLISDAAKERLNREYAALMAYLEYSNTAKTATTNVEIAGLAEKVALPAESATAAKTVISVVMKDEKPSIMPPLPAGKSEALSVDIKLVASIYNDSGNATPTATETVQPKSGESVLVKLRLPTGYELDTLEIWHVKDSGARSRITDFWLVTENDVTYAVFEVSSFSHFVFYAEKTASSGGTVTPPTPKPDIPNSDHGSTTVTPQQPRPGDKITVNPKPDEGYVVDKVIVTDQNGKDIPVKDNGDGTYSYTQPNGKVTVTVTFKPEVVHLPWNPFTDVTESNWFYESVKYVYEKGLMVGTSDSTFSPYLTTSRGMIVTILWRLEGEPTAIDANPFADVTADKYYAAAIAWGAENGIVKGYGNGNFGPNDPITREQLASILYRYAQFKGMDTTAKGNMAQFADQPSAWAAEAVQWAVGAGIITGKGNRILDPTGQATRAEVATMLIRMG